MVKDTAKGAGLLLNRYRHAFRAAALQSQTDEHHMEIVFFVIMMRKLMKKLCGLFLCGKIFCKFA